MAMPSALAIASAANIAAFERAWPPLAGNRALTALPRDSKARLLQRLILMETSVLSFSLDHEYAKVAAAVLSAVKDGDGMALAAMSNKVDTPHVAPLQRIGAFSASVRRSFELRGIFRHSRGMMLAFGTPHSGNWLIFADLDTPQGGPPTLRDLVAVDLSQVK